MNYIPIADINNVHVLRDNILPLFNTQTIGIIRKSHENSPSIIYLWRTFLLIFFYNKFLMKLWKEE